MTRGHPGNQIRNSSRVRSAKERKQQAKHGIDFVEALEIEARPSRRQRCFREAILGDRHNHPRHWSAIITYRGARIRIPVGEAVGFPAAGVLPPFPFLADSRFSRFETQSLPSQLSLLSRKFPFLDFASTSLRIFSVCASAFEWRSVCAQPMWLWVVLLRTLAAFAILCVPCAAASCPDRP